MKEKTFRAEIESIPQVIAFIDAELETLDCSMRAQTQIDVAIDEVFANISSYAYGADTGEAEVRFDFDESTRTASITFLDTGKPFDPLSRKDPDVTLSAEERSIGGLGIFLVKKTMDRVDYQYEGGKNILTIFKKI